MVISQVKVKFANNEREFFVSRSVAMMKISLPSGAVKAAYDHYPSVATPSAAGLMSATDKTKVDNLRRIFYGTSTPSGAIAGDFWFDTN